MVRIISKFFSLVEEFYFSRDWFAKKMRHVFVVDRSSGEFETITTYDSVEKQSKFKIKYTLNNFSYY
jgi:hypothetical protein